MTTDTFPFERAIRWAASHFGPRHLQDDLVQEGALTALLVVRAYPELSGAPLRKVVVRAVINRVIDCSRRERLRATAPLEHEPAVQPPAEFPWELFEAIRVRLSARAQAVLQERVEPSDATRAAAEADRSRKGRKMCSDSGEIHLKHVAKGLGLSPATVSRAFAEIETAAREVMRCEIRRGYARR